jgi:ATP/ADP translocase
LIAQSNEVIATSGFISQVGANQIVWLWVIDMLIVMLTSTAYALVVDRFKRGILALCIFTIFCPIYLGLYMFSTQPFPTWIFYSLLTVVNDQQWLLLPLIVWSLASDVFATAAAKRLFPILGSVALIGAIVGNSIAAAVAQWLGAQSTMLLLFNAGLVLVATSILSVAMRYMTRHARQSTNAEGIVETLVEGWEFIVEVPIFRYLAVALILLGACFTVIEFQFLVDVAVAFSNPTDLQSFYGLFKSISIATLLLIQSVVTGKLLNRTGFKSIFLLFPSAVLIGLLLTLIGPNLFGVIIGNYIVRVVLLGIDQPARKAFQGLVPDERRGRVGAFLDGFVYPIGAVLGSVMIGLILLAVENRMMIPDTGRLIYLGVACVAGVLALWAALQFRAFYDTSMLNWRLQGRRKSAGILADIEF